MEEQTYSSETLARLVFDAMGEKQTEDMLLLDIRPVSVITDFFVIGTANNARQMRAVAEGIEKDVREETGIKPRSVDGTADSGWMLVDYGDVVAHIFDATRRDFYQLESVWGEAPLVARMA